MSITAAQLADLMPDATAVESNEPEMESSLHYAQLALLVACLEWVWRDQTNFFIGANLTVYFSRQQLKNRDFRGPDFFLVKHTQKRPRKSWVVWEENGKYPDLIIELLSDTTAGVDRSLKKDLYQNQFRTHEYFWFSPETLEFAGFRLLGGQYQPIAPHPSGWLWSEQLDLYLGVLESQLRYFDADGQLIPTPQEDAEQSERRAERLAEQLRSLGIEPEA
ncbi:MAG: Uma2 family endonuclease [Leptolyngbyaceae bacterium]|nr:Uma2 family endonuclease [Leptolyngbyaceae bacterium]